MLQTFATIEANKYILATRDVQTLFVENIQRKSLLKSSLFSAQIEGNTLTLSEAEQLSEKNVYDKGKREVTNLMRALSFLRKTPVVSFFDQDFILRLHNIAMDGLIERERRGKLRKEPSAIFNEAGFAVYVTPSPSQIPLLLEDLIHYINGTSEKNIPIKAIVSHYIFEKIHPFLDGNGRVGRLLIQAILATGGYHFNWLLSFEEILNERKIEYYSYLDQNDVTPFVEFMLEVLMSASENSIKLVDNQKEYNKEDSLLPRRKEILLLIREQQLLSFDRIRRRFLIIPERTLRYDLLQLQKGGFIMKLGTTKGVLYKTKQ